MCDSVQATLEINVFYGLCTCMFNVNKSRYATYFEQPKWLFAP